MSTLGSLYALMGQNMPQPYAEGLRTVLGNERLQTQGQTDLIQLAELQRAQQQQAAERQFMAQHPELFMGQGQQGPQSVLGGGAGQPPMMQQTISPGRAAGQAMAVPEGQDLSRFATQGQPPAGSTLGQPGPPPQGPPDPLMALMRTNPDAALAVQDRMQKIQQQRLTSDLDTWRVCRAHLAGCQLLRRVSTMPGGTLDVTCHSLRHNCRQPTPKRRCNPTLTGRSA